MATLVDAIVYLISGFAVGVATYVVILFTRRFAQQIERQTEKRKSLEKMQAESEEVIVTLKALLDDREKELARLKDQMKEHREQDDARSQKMAEIVAEVEKVLARLAEEEEEERRKMRRRELRKRENE